MKCLLYIITIIALLTSCNKNADDILQNNNSIAGFNPADNGIEPAPAYKWTSLQVPSDNSYPSPAERNLVIQVGNDIYCTTGSSGRVFKLNNDTRHWELHEETNIALSNLDVGWQYLFTYGSKIYMGLVMYNNALVPRMKSYDMNTHAFVDLPDFPGTPVWEPTCFVIGNKGYLMGGTNNSDNPVNHLWEFNFTTNQWTSKGNSPFGARTGMSAFVINSKVYGGLGYDIMYANNTPVKMYKDDWISFTPGSALSAIKADFPGEKRAYAKGFIMNDNIYMGFGYKNTSNTNTYYKNFWKYNVSNNNWIEMDSWPGTVGTITGTNISIFSIGSTGYLVKGALNQFWQFSNSLFIPTN